MSQGLSANPYEFWMDFHCARFFVAKSMLDLLHDIKLDVGTLVKALDDFVPAQSPGRDSKIQAFGEPYQRLGKRVEDYIGAYTSPLQHFVEFPLYRQVDDTIRLTIREYLTRDKPFFIDDLTSLTEAKCKDLWVDYQCLPTALENLRQSLVDCHRTGELVRMAGPQSSPQGGQAPTLCPLNKAKIKELSSSDRLETLKTYKSLPDPPLYKPAGENGYFCPAAILDWAQKLIPIIRDKDDMRPTDKTKILHSLKEFLGEFEKYYRHHKPHADQARSLLRLLRLLQSTSAQDPTADQPGSLASQDASEEE